MAKFTQEDIGNYLNNFPQVQHDNVIKALIDEDILKTALSTEQGKVILNGAVTSIRDNVMKIIQNCHDLAIIQSSAVEINALYKIIYQWGKIMAEGEHHTTKMKKTRS